ncbi:Aldose 1-epimerase precursor [Novipirellula aureliae]|uniref:Aldose 1-epimerase n=1 Tax=Novipirellula aureliae TaxID=2527966 RepID=A0A5C6DY83_9BACT|nr:aldose epimerase family protein [Novipirellula aureliae]TWU40361.1 Aldose 1-epimerase precursor [Novipirellula aureliae]
MKINTDIFGATDAGLEISRFCLVNSHGNEVYLMNWGATLLDVIVPDAKGNRDNVNVSFTNLQPYLDEHPYLGATVGRFCNRIGNASFEIGGKKYSLTQNHGDHHLHGGNKGLTYQRWDSEPYQENGTVGVRFTITSPDGEEGYPGNVSVTADYNWNDQNELAIVYSATTDAATHINLTNHSYWNLAGALSGTALHHVAEICADQILKTDKDCIPTGELTDIEGTAWDFATPTALGARIDQVSANSGYDDCYVVRGEAGQLRQAARVVDPQSGRVLEIETTQPGMQLYTANFLPGDGRSNGVGGHEAFCLETQRYPNTPNVDSFPSTLLKPGEVYKETTIHRFSVER